MQSVTFAITRRTALLIRSTLRNTPLRREWDSAVLWDIDDTSHAESSTPGEGAAKLHTTVSVDFLERLTEAVFTSSQLRNGVGHGANNREIANFVHRMNITAQRRLNAWD